MIIGNDKKIIFMGTPDFAVPSLKNLITQGFDVVAVYTREPKQRGRGKKLQKTPIHTLADAHGIEVLTPETLKSESELEKFRSFQADLCVVIAYGKILPQSILDACPYGSVNVHGSLLPRWRGAAPINRAIMAGDTETGIDIMLMDAGLDTGPILASRRINISNTDTAGDIHDQLSTLGAEILPYVLRAWLDGNITPIPQTHHTANYAAKLTAEDRRINWAKPAPLIHKQIMGLSPRPGAWCLLQASPDKDPIRVMIVKSDIPSSDISSSVDISETDSETTFAENIGKFEITPKGDIRVLCGQGSVTLISLKPAGGKTLDGKAFATGYLQQNENHPVSFV